MLGFATSSRALLYFHTVGAKNLFKISSISKVMILAKNVAAILIGSAEVDSTKCLMIKR